MPKHLRGISFLLHHHILAGFLSYREFSVPFPPEFIKTNTKNTHTGLSSQPEDNHLPEAEKKCWWLGKKWLCPRGAGVEDLWLNNKILTWLSSSYSYCAHTEAAPPSLKPLPAPGNFFLFQQEQKH